MRKRRVAILYTHTLFGQGIAHLLEADKQLQVTCVRAGDANSIDQLKRLRPHAIVMEGCQENASHQDLDQDLPPALFIAVRFEDNLMHVYRSRQVLAARPETLLNAIHDGLKIPSHAPNPHG